MKSALIVFIFSAITHDAIAQPVSRTIEATKVDLTDSGNNIIGKMVIIPGLSRDMFLKEYSKKDSSHFYITEYKFVQLNPLVQHM